MKVDSSSIIKLGLVASVYGGGTPKSDIPEYWDGDVCWLTPPDITTSNTKEVFDSRRRISALGLANSGSVLLAKDSVIMTSRASIGDCAIARVPVSMNQGLTAFVCNPSRLKPEFLMWQIDARKRELVRRASGSTFLELSRQEAKSFPIWCPSLEEQERLSLLHRAFAKCISLLGEQLDRVTTAKMAFAANSAFYEIKNATHYRLGELFKERKQAGEHGLRTFSVTRGQGLVDREKLGRKVESELTAEQHLLVRKNDIAYNMMRMWQGVSGLAPCDGVVSPAYVVLKPTEKIDPLYASYLFKVPEVIRLFHRFSQGLTNDRLRLYYDQFKDIKVRIPKSLDEQRRVAKLLQAFDKKAAVLKSRVEQLTRLKTALSQEIFN